MKAVLFGPPNSGKGTISGMLSEHYKISHLATGDMFRQLAEEGSEVGIMARDKYWGKGLLVPDDITIKLLKEMISKPEYEKGFFMDGFPRTIDQAKELDKILGKDYLIVNFEISHETLVDRASGRRVCEGCGAIYHIRNVPPKKEGVCDKCGGKLQQRKDDKPEIFKERLTVYNKQTKPVLDYYGDRVINVDGEGTPQPIFERVVKVLEKGNQ